MAQRQPLKVLMLHGFTQSGPLFHAKTKALEKLLRKAFPMGLELVYPTAPVPIRPSDIPNFLSSTADTSTESDTGEDKAKAVVGDTDSWGWWIRKGDAEPFTYDKMGEGFAKIAEVLKSDGPFDGVIGFSQGGAAAGMVASLLEPGRREAFKNYESRGGMAFPETFEEPIGAGQDVIHPPMKFAVSYSGFGASTNSLYQAFYDPKIQTPMLHFLGSVDTVVEEARSLRLVAACADQGGPDASRVIRHPGGHFLVSGKQYVGVLIDFIQDTMGWSTKTATAPEEDVNDMQMPF